MLNIGVIGGSTAEKKYLEIAEKIGRLLASRKVVVICGGKNGVMESVSRGVHEAGGTVVGILPGTSSSEGNAYLTVSIPTGIGYARNFLIVRASDALIAIDGSTGTLSEASFALTEGKSVVSIGTHIETKLKDGDGKFLSVQTAEQAVELVMKEAQDHRDSQGPVSEED
ncbi:MAG: TIGR00725 family protein [Thermoplasmatales archaeon]|nr:TIGR00725 family protein [Thermoplasmatales archaeon]MCW6171154.1 TIGR00725 family protein [Thermoplasmatales archaeon]